MPEGSITDYAVVSAVSLALLVVTGLTAGLATGFLSLDPTHLEVLRRSGSDLQRRTALRLQALLSRHNLVLFSIVLLHAIADEALPLVLERAFNEYVAVALSVPLVLLFGEVLPSAVFASKATGDGVTALTASLAPLMWACVALVGAVTLPLSWVVDRCSCCCASRSHGNAAAGATHHGHGLRAYRRHELAAFLRIHAAAGDDDGDSLSSWPQRRSSAGSESDGRQRGGGSSDRGDNGSYAGDAGRASRSPTSGFRVPLLRDDRLPPLPTEIKAANALPVPLGATAINFGVVSPLSHASREHRDEVVGGEDLREPASLQMRDLGSVGGNEGKQSRDTQALRDPEPRRDEVRAAATTATRGPAVNFSAPPIPLPPAVAAPALPHAATLTRNASTPLVSLVPPAAGGAGILASPGRDSSSASEVPLSDSVAAAAASVASAGALTLAASGTTEDAASPAVASGTGTDGSSSAASGPVPHASDGTGAAAGVAAGPPSSEASLVRSTPCASPAILGHTEAHALEHVPTRANLLSRIASSPAMQFWRSAAPWRRVTPHVSVAAGDEEVLPPDLNGPIAESSTDAEDGYVGGNASPAKAAAAAPAVGVSRPVPEHAPHADAAFPASQQRSSRGIHANAHPFHPPQHTHPAHHEVQIAVHARGGAHPHHNPSASAAVGIDNGPIAKAASGVDTRLHWPAGPPGSANYLSSDSAAGSSSERPRRHHHRDLSTHQDGSSNAGASGAPRPHARSYHASSGGGSGSVERGGSLTRSELSLLEGTLGLMSRTVASRMVPLDRIFSLTEATLVDAEMLCRVADTAHSRIPVLAGNGTDRHAIVGLLLVKALLRLPEVLLQRERSSTEPQQHALVAAEEPFPAPMPPPPRPLLVGDLPLLPPCALHPHTTMLDALRTFQFERCHMAVVTRHVDEARTALSRRGSSGAGDATGGETISMRRLPAGLHILGIITLEDCLLAVLNDDAHAQAQGSGGAPPSRSAHGPGGEEASSRGHGGHGHSHHGPGGASSSRRGGGGGGGASGGGSLISDASDMQHVARILARRQQHPHLHAHVVHPHPHAHHPQGGAAATTAAPHASAEDQGVNSS